MIAYEKVNNLTVDKTWGTPPKPLFQNQIMISGPTIAYPNIVVSAAKGSGKTVLAVNLCKYLASSLTKIIIFSSTFSDGDDSSAFDDLKRNYPNMIEIYPNMSHNNINLLKVNYQKAKLRMVQIKKSDIIENTFPNYIFMYDDINEDDDLSAIKNVFKKNRHAGLVNILIQHDYKNLTDTMTRGNTDIICIFRGLPAREIKAVWEWSSQPISLKEFQTIYHDITSSNGRNFMMINKTTGEIRKNLNEIVIRE